MGQKYMDSVHEDDLPRLLASDLNRYFRNFVLIYQDQLYTFVLRRLTHDTQDAMDVAIAVFVKAYYALLQYSASDIEKMHFWPWLCTIARNSYYDDLRKHKIYSVSLDTPEYSWLLEEKEDNQSEQPDIVVENQEQSIEFRKKVDELLAKIPPQYRIAVKLRHIDELSYTDIAKQLRTSVKTVKAHVGYGMRLLRKEVRSCQHSK